MERRRKSRWSGGCEEGWKEGEERGKRKRKRRRRGREETEGERRRERGREREREREMFVGGRAGFMNASKSRGGEP